MKRILTIFILTFLMFYEVTTAQVTIGSGSQPETAALLQIKSQEPDASNITSTQGGIVLSRVALENLNTLEPFIATTDMNYALQKKAHAGLFVYNVSKTTPFVPGLYVWDGEHWNILMSSNNPNYTTNPDNDKGTQIPQLKDAIFSPNSYIVAPGSSISIPVIKAYAVWKLQLDTDIDLNQHKITTELLWQDEKGLVSKINLKEDINKNQSLIQISTNKDVTGNAVVVVKMDGVIRWSWHLWITDYKPEEKNGQNTDNQTIFMDRYLGATSASQGYTSTIGLLYQWGRKDPFSGSASTTASKEKQHYTIDNKLIDKTIVQTPVTVAINLPNAIINPITFYTSAVDWHSNSGQVNNHMWMNADNTKGVYDPCPEGWRVPVSTADNASVWNGLKGKGKHFETGKGAEWEGYGYYQASGRRNWKGELDLVGKEAYVWSAKNFYDDQAYRLNVADYNVYPQHSTNKAYAHSVRCVKTM